MWNRILFARSSIFVAACVLLAGCPWKSVEPHLKGHWVVDIDRTISQAKQDGMPAAAEPRIREMFTDGLLEITSDQLVMRVAGYDGVESAGYRVARSSGGCDDLVVDGSPRKHSYCVSGDELVVRDPSTKIAVVYRRQ